jgi:hypothetical protein
MLGFGRGSIDPRKIRPHEISEIGQPDERIASLEQWPAKFSFQLPDRNRDRRLFDAAAVGGPRKTFFFAKREKIRDLMHFHDAAPLISSRKIYGVRNGRRDERNRERQHIERQPYRGDGGFAAMMNLFIVRLPTIPNGMPAVGSEFQIVHEYAHGRPPSS